MEERDLQGLYIDRLNSEILPGIDYGRLDRSCNGQDTGYAVEVLRNLHEAFVEVYGTDDLDGSYEFTCVPAVVRGRTSGHLAVGLALLDLQSSGEHYGTYFFTPLGVIDNGAEDNSPNEHSYLKQHFAPYDYWYTVYIERDIHVDFEHVPKAVADILNEVYSDLHPGMELEQ